MTGTTIAQSIPIAISPVLTRLYSPKDFGVYSLFVATTSIFAAIANGRYELAIMLPEHDEDALNVGALCLLIAAALSLLLLVLVIAFGGGIADLLGSQELRPWLYVAPPTVLLMGGYNVLVFFNTRSKNFKDLAKAGVVKGIALAAAQVVLGFLRFGPAGLVLGQLVSNFFANAKLIRNSLGGRDVRALVSWGRMKANAAKFRDFPIYSMPGILANTLAQNIGNMLVSAFFSVATLGQYALMQRVLNVPSTFVGKSIGQVFYQQASLQMREAGDAQPVFRETLVKLSAISLPVFAVLYFVIEDLFEIVFGGEWRIAGTFAKVMIPLYAIRFIVSPLSMMNQVYLKNITGMLTNFAILGVSVGVLWYGGLNRVPLLTTLQLLSAALSIVYLGMLAVMAAYRPVAR